MFWRMAGMATTSPVESLLDKDTFTIEELLDEDDLIQECKSLNSRLINFLRNPSQIKQLVRYVVEEPLEDAGDKRTFKFPFIACEIFTCEIEVILKTLVEDDEIMGLLFSFLDSDRPHGTLLAGYFSKVVICLMLRKTVAMMRYLQEHWEILQKLVDLIAITSIMEVLVRLVGADETVSAFYEESLYWLAETDLLELLMEKLSQNNPSEVRANAAGTLCAISHLSQSALAKKLCSPSYIARLFHHALEGPDSKSTLIHCLSVCISLLDPKKCMLGGMGRGQYVPDSSSSTCTISSETVEGMLQRLGDLLKLLDISEDEKVVPTTYGKLCPPLGVHRLMIVEFLAVLLHTNSVGARQEMVKLGAIQTVLRLFFQYPFNNFLHRHVENIVRYCIESNSKLLIDHVLKDCHLVERVLEADGNPYTLSTESKPTLAISMMAPPRIGSIGHITIIANRLAQAANGNPDIKAYLEDKPEWLQWQSSILQGRNATENVYGWTCGRPTTVRDRPIHTDDDFRGGVNVMAQHMTREVFCYEVFENEDMDEGLGVPERDNNVFFDNESAEVISSLRLGEEHDRSRSKENFLSAGNWFAFPDDRSIHSIDNLLVSSTVLKHEGSEVNANISSSNTSSSNDEMVVVGGDGLVDTAHSVENPFLSSSCMVDIGSQGKTLQGRGGNHLDDFSLDMERGSLVRPLDWANWNDATLDGTSTLEGTSGRQMAFSSTNPFTDDLMEGQKHEILQLGLQHGTELANASLSIEQHGDTMATIFYDAVKYTGVEAEGAAKGMEHALHDGVVGEAGLIHPVKHASPVKLEGEENMDGGLDFNDVNYWRSDYGHSATEVEST